MIKRKQDLAALLFLSFLTAVLFAALIPANPTPEHDADFYFNAHYTKRFAEEGRIVRPNFLYHVLAGSLAATIPSLTPGEAGFLVILLADVLLSLLLYIVVRSSLPAEPSWTCSVVAVFSAIAFSLLAPVSFLTWKTDNYYFGYIPLSVYHSPTFLMLRPIALLHFFLAVKIFTNRPRAGLLAFLTLLSALAKPNYIMSLVPASCVLAAWRWLTRRRIQWIALMVGLLLPALLHLAWQYYFYFTAPKQRPAVVDSDLIKAELHKFYKVKREKPPLPPQQMGIHLAKTMTRMSHAEIGREFGGRSVREVNRILRKIDRRWDQDNRLRRDAALLTERINKKMQEPQESGIAFAPLVVARMYSSHLFVKFVMSILFPLVVLIVHFDSARKDTALLLAWLSFGAGAAQSYLLAETGTRMDHWNFLWGAEITLFILFVASFLLVIRNPGTAAGNSGTKVKLYVSLLALSLHLISGIAWYLFYRIGGQMLMR